MTSVYPSPVSPGLSRFPPASPRVPYLLLHPLLSFREDIGEVPRARGCPRDVPDRCDAFILGGRQGPGRASSGEELEPADRFSSLNFAHPACPFFVSLWDYASYKFVILTYLFEERGHSESLWLF